MLSGLLVLELGSRGRQTGDFDETSFAPLEIFSPPQRCNELYSALLCFSTLEHAAAAAAAIKLETACDATKLMMLLLCYWECQQLPHASDQILYKLSFKEF